MPRHRIPKQRVADHIGDDLYLCDPGLPKVTATPILPCPPALNPSFQVEAFFGEVSAAAFEQAQLRAQMAEERCKQLESMLEFGQAPMQAVLCQNPFVADTTHLVAPPPAPVDSHAPRERLQADGKGHVDRHGKRHGYGRIPPPSRGSKNHNFKQCRPCRRLFTPGGCPEGALCNFCHYAHDIKDNKSDGSRESRDVSTTDSEHQDEAPQEKKNYDLFEGGSQTDTPWYIVPTMKEPWYVASAPPGLA
mmetsp:Transcript_23230/g.37159  ORF Transcript_23230/g.37159 Transcript_23230/m.37159 type:complete len:248 (+) Transcript_23230:58-801(+)